MRAIAIPLLLLSLALPALADQVTFSDGRKPTGKDVVVVSEDCEKVVYKVGGAPQIEPAADVEDVVYTDGPGRAAAAKLRALFDRAESLRLAGATSTAVAAYDAVLQAAPRTRLYARVRLGRARSRLASGDRAGAQRELAALEGEVAAKKLGARWGDAATFALAEVLEAGDDRRGALERYRKLADGIAARGKDAEGLGARARIAAERLAAALAPASSGTRAAAGFEQTIAAEYAKPRPSFAVIAAAYVAAGDVHARAGEHKAALLAYLRVAVGDDFRDLRAERPRALRLAMDELAEVKGPAWEERARVLGAELAAYKDSPWARDAAGRGVSR